MDEIVEGSPSPKPITPWKSVSLSIHRSLPLSHDHKESIDQKNRTRKRWQSLIPLKFNSSRSEAVYISEDDWLPITESRSGNTFSAAFHLICSGIGFQALLLPFSFSILGWTWGILWLKAIFMWQFYTIYLLVQLHESHHEGTGIRYSRYLQLCVAAFGKKVTYWAILFPIMELSLSTCIILTVMGGSNLKSLFKILCEAAACTEKPLSTVEWHLVFSSGVVILSQLPNLNSFTGVALIGAISAVGVCTLLPAVSVSQGRIPGVSYTPLHASSQVADIFGVTEAVGFIAFAFRGHNLILEIQATMSSSEKSPSQVPMWKGVKFAYLVIGSCLCSLAVGGYWVYGNMIPKNGGIMVALLVFHGRDTSQLILGIISLLFIVNSMSTFQIYAIPIFDMMESMFTSRYKKPCPWWLRALSRVVFGYFCFFLSVAISFYGSVESLGGFSLPVALAFPCFMWIKIKKPKVYTLMWWLNWGLGVLGFVLSGVLIASGVYSLVNSGIEVKFFKLS